MSESRVLSLFESPGPIPTGTPGATAWLARDAASGRPVLIKRLANTQGRARLSEALAVVHPGIVRIRRWLIADGALYVVRDVARGKNLRQALGDARPDLDTLRRLFLPAFDALESAHAAGVFHGGLSLENLIVPGAAAETALLLCDIATTHPDDPRHRPIYGGMATSVGDVRALGQLIAPLLPMTGTFALPAVRSRIESLILRCERLPDLRETLAALEKLAVAPLPRLRPSLPAVPPEPVVLTPRGKATGTAEIRGTARLAVVQIERPDTIVQGGGGAIAVTVRNIGDASLVIRMVATQHAWLNVRPLPLPVTLLPDESARVQLVLSAARLAPGEYRSEVYFSANAPGDHAEDLRSGWFRHTAEIRVAVTARPRL